MFHGTLWNCERTATMGCGYGVGSDVLDAARGLGRWKTALASALNRWAGLRAGLLVWGWGCCFPVRFWLRFPNGLCRFVPDCLRISHARDFQDFDDDHDFCWWPF